jgi:hypothetical protein
VGLGHKKTDVFPHIGSVVSLSRTLKSQQRYEKPSNYQTPPSSGVCFLLPFLNE